MIVTTTHSIEGQKIEEYMGLVSAESVIGANFLKDITASIRDFLGGRSSSYEKVLQEAKQTALNEMQDMARELGANAVIGVDLDYEAVGGQSSMLMVVATGTAVKLA